MNRQRRIVRRLPNPPKIAFPGGHVQIVNPRHPIANVWSDILHLKPGRELPAHIHEHTSSLLICIGGSGEAAVEGRRTRLRKGVCVFIPSGANHCVKAAKTQVLSCLSINEGIIKPSVSTDIVFNGRKDAPANRKWLRFAAVCATTAGTFQQQMTKGGSTWHTFRLYV